MKFTLSANLCPLALLAMKDAAQRRLSPFRPLRSCLRRSGGKDDGGKTARI